MVVGVSACKFFASESYDAGVLFYHILGEPTNSCSVSHQRILAPRKKVSFIVCRFYYALHSDLVLVDTRESGYRGRSRTSSPRTV